MKTLTHYCLASALIVGSSAAVAQGTTGTETDRNQSGVQDNPGHLYLGLGYGGFRAKGGDFDDDNDFFEGKFGGYFTPYIGMEASATYFGNYGGDALSADVKGYGISLLGRLPLSDNWGLYAKGGQFFWDTDVDSALGSYSIDGDDFFYGVGMDFGLTSSVSMIVEYNRYDIDTRVDDLPGAESTDLDTLQVGVRFRF